MRPRKNMLVLSLDNLLGLMIPGRPYTVAMLACIFDGSPTAILGALTILEARGTLHSSIAPKESREERRCFWRTADGGANTAQRRVGPAEIPGTLTGYDLMRHQRLCTETRKS